MSTSRAMGNVVWVLLLANWLMEGRWEEKWRMAKESRLLHAFVALYAAYAVAILRSPDMTKGLAGLEIRLPLLVLPLVLLTTPPVRGRERSVILWLYAITIAAVSVVGAVRLATIPDLPYRSAVPFVSHIRFALNCCAVMFLCILEPARGRWRYAGYALALWLFVYQLLLHSYTTVAVMVVGTLLLLIWYRKWRALAVWCGALAVVVLLVVMGCRSYYRLVPQARAPLADVTANGRPYSHKQDGFIENGNYVNNYVCMEELERQWPERSRMRLDSVEADGFTLMPVLIRYLNALGLPKDSVGVASLTDGQVHDIERGIPNPVYAHSSHPKRMLYGALFEYESYRCYHAVKGFSMLQRLELWKATLKVIKKHPWFGVGTLDVRRSMREEMLKTGSPMAESDFFPHNQYLTWTAMFGLVSLAVVLAMFLRATPSLRRQRPLLLAWLLIALISFLTEDTLGSLAGRLFCLWPLAFREPKESRETQ